MPKQKRNTVKLRPNTHRNLKLAENFPKTPKLNANKNVIIITGIVKHGDMAYWKRTNTPAINGMAKRINGDCLRNVIELFKLQY
jgi:hypothetical protein